MSEPTFDHHTQENVRVIVIEDNEDDRILLLRQLHNAQMSEYIKFIHDGEEAVKYLSQNATRLASSLMVVFLDLRLPNMHGVEVLKKIRAISELSSIPVVVMTSTNDPMEIQKCKELQVAQWVEKPVTFATFSKSIADIFHQAKNI